MHIRSEQRLFDGRMLFVEHDSTSVAENMRFAVFLPPAAEGAKGRRVPALYFLAGLSCTEETFTIKAGAQRVAAALGLALIAPDTSPRAARFPGDDAHWDFGLGAGFYIDATEEPWARAYRMESYVVDELPRLVEAELPISRARSICGHSMGGHGALTLALRHPERYRSVSAFAPVSSPSQVPWGQKAFTNYLGSDRRVWAEHDATELVKTRQLPFTLLIDQGTHDKFLHDQLRPELFQAQCATFGQQIDLRLREGYDHSYWFIATFIEEHLRHHARALGL
jgi:S-formylglutathione hydrolase